MSNNNHKSIFSFPNSQHDPEPKRPDEAASYLAYLLDLADRLFDGGTSRDREEESAA